MRSPDRLSPFPLIVMAPTTRLYFAQLACSSDNNAYCTVTSTKILYAPRRRKETTFHCQHFQQVPRYNRTTLYSASEIRIFRITFSQIQYPECITMVSSLRRLQFHHSFFFTGKKKTLADMITRLFFSKRQSDAAKNPPDLYCDFDIFILMSTTNAGSTNDAIPRRPILRIAFPTPLINGH